ncbi:hypothetical protein SteCoe_11196 [Stentor coeruleus]|uniref:chitin synthase n=1 Tax=Stentor coeruleus TaxID=5963 RepID=A0A1R2CDP4_9CILI|nr:hypothetical protein SteCoe_11196 [Stentor coeruleus]
MAHGRSMSSQFVTSLVYQPVELLTEYEVEQINGITYNKLAKVEGITPLFPETKFKPSVLSDLMKTDGELEFLIVVTMYNEDKNNFKDTMHGIVQNLKVFESDGLDPNLIACIIIVDGIKPFMQTYKKDDQKIFFSNFFNEQMIKDRFSTDDVINGIKLEENQEIAHCFMTSTNFGLEGCPDLNIVFAVKQLNKRKLNTHLWFFGGFCEMIQPKFIMLLDVGTKPLEASLCALYDVLKTNANIAGVCGEIAPMDPEYSNIVVSAQTVEYTFSHIFDKAMESCLGYIGVLPGAFSAYRWEALAAGPLMNDYFKSMTSPELMNAYNSNIFLAEDRVLSLALVSLPGHQYLLRFVPSAIAETDVPAKLFQLLAQRRRWINGSWFALIDTWRTFSRIKNSDHTRWRKIWFSFQLVYFGVTILFTWVMVGSFYLFTELIFAAIFKGFDQSAGGIMTLTEFLLSVYIAMILLVFMMSLGVKTGRVEGTYRFISFGFSFYMLFTFFCTMYYTFTSNLTVYSWFLVAATIGSYSIGLLITGNTKKVALRTVQFLMMTPIYVNVFQIYAICNIHDCTWGNRPDNLTEEEKAKREDFEHYRTKWVIIWIVSNLVYVKIFETFIQIDSELIALYVLYTMAMILILIRFCGCIAFYFSNWFQNKGSKRYIRLGSVVEANKEDKRILTEIVQKVNRGRAMSQKEIRNSIIGVIEKKAGNNERRQTQFQKDILKMCRKSELLEDDVEEEGYSESIEENSNESDEDCSEYYNANSGKTKKIKKQTKKTKKTNGKSVKKSVRESVRKSVRESKREKKDESKFSPIQSKVDAKIDAKNAEGMINFEDTIQKDPLWENDEEGEESKNQESEVNKYLDMLSLIISNISDSN